LASDLNTKFAESTIAFLMNAIVSFALVVVQHPDDERFCLVHEKGKRGWWLPGGGVDAGQTFAEAAVREAEEEAGVHCRLTGILRVDCTSPSCGRLRVIFFARPCDASIPLKSIPDHHSKGAIWVTLDQLDAIAERRVGAVTGVAADTCYLRGPEPYHWFHYVAKGGTIYPLSALDTVRRGVVPEWDGPGDPPRALYPTTFRVALVYIEKGEVAATSSSHVPSAIISNSGYKSLESSAQELANQLGLGLVAGVIKIRHILDCRAKDAGAHTAILEVSFATHTTTLGLQGDLKWTPWTGVQHVVVAHDNLDLHRLVTGWEHAGWTVHIFDKKDVVSAIQELTVWRGSPLICTSTFPLDQVPCESSILIWSKTATENPTEKARLFSEGAAFVASNLDYSDQGSAMLLAEVKARSWPCVGSGESLELLQDEGNPPPSPS